MRFSSVDRVLARWLLGIVLAVVIALVTLGLINSLVYGPGGQVRAYFLALSEGDGAQALGILGADAPDANGAVLDGAPLRVAVSEIEDMHTDSIEVTDDGERASVTVTYQIAGEEHSTVLRLHKVGSHWGVFDQWQIDAGALPTVKVTSSQVDAATLNNMKVSLDEGSREFAVLYPGIYTVSYESALYSSVSESVVVTGEDETLSLSVELEPSSTALASVQQQVKSYLDTCAAQSTLYPGGCPFEFDFAGRVDGAVTWTVTEYPQPQVTLEKGRWSLGQGQGVVQVSFTELDLLTGERSMVTEELPFILAGSLQVGDDSLTFVPFLAASGVQVQPAAD